MANNVRILLAEDDYNVGCVLKKRLEEKGYVVTYCPDGEMAWQHFQKNGYDLCLLDVMMPKRNGFDLARLIRNRSDAIPIIFLSSKHEDEHKISGFKHGADDYVTKPFNLTELLMRMAVFLRRARINTDDKSHIFLIASKYVFDPYSRTFEDKRGNYQEGVTPKEAKLIKFLCEHAKKALKRDEILLHVWGKDDYFLGRSMDVFLTKLRKRFAEDKDIEIVTLHGVGIRFDADIELVRKESKG